ncbi:MAG: phosphoglucomutase/phosphomannomutase family protein, partial [Dermabacteraceae bacterium]
ISAKMAETDAVIGGESSGGLTVRGHIPGKDGIQAAGLLVEMVARSGKKLSQLYAELVERHGSLVMEEAAYGYTPERRQELQQRIFSDHELPAFDREIDRISWEDGGKIYFADDSWLTIRFSGTEPVIRVFSEAATAAQAQDLSRTVATHYRLGA